MLLGEQVELSVAVPEVVPKLSLVDLPVLPDVDAEAFLLVEPVVALVGLILVRPDAVAVPDSLLEVALVDTLVDPEVLPVPVSHAVDVLA